MFFFKNSSMADYDKTFYDFIKKMVPHRTLNPFGFETSNNYWKNKENQKKALVYLGRKLGFKRKKDWYGITYNDFRVNSFDSLLRYHDYSYPKAITTILKSYKFDKYKTKKIIPVKSQF